jgi:hypothetical protein
MIRKDLYFTKQQIEKLKELSIETGLTVSELIRRAIDSFLSKETKKDGNNKLERS